MASSLDSIRVLSETIPPVSKSGRPAVIVVTSSTEESYDLESWKQPQRRWAAYRRYVNILTNHGVIIIVAAGNAGGRNQNVDTYPGLLAEDPLSPLIIASATDNWGRKRPTAQRSRRVPPIWAPGTEVQCASSLDYRSNIYASGTSFSAGMVSNGCMQSVSQISPKDKVSTC